jgi:2-dehydropantoate 2-reductase
MAISLSGTAPLQIAVMGAGAVGCYFGGMLARAGHDVTLIARPAHVQAIEANGLRMETKTFDEQVRIGASTAVSAVKDAQLVLFCVKSTDNSSSAQVGARNVPAC